MDETGKLVLGYLGTDPATNVVNVQSEAKEFNYDDMDEELRRLQTVIREATSSKFFHGNQYSFLFLATKTEPTDHIVLKIERPPVKVKFRNFFEFS